MLPLLFNCPFFSLLHCCRLQTSLEDFNKNLKGPCCVVLCSVSHTEYLRLEDISTARANPLHLLHFNCKVSMAWHGLVFPSFPKFLLIVHLVPASSLVYHLMSHLIFVIRYLSHYPPAGARHEEILASQDRRQGLSVNMSGYHRTATTSPSYRNIHKFSK